MELTEAMIEQLKADLSNAKNYDDLMGKDGAIKKLMAKTLEQMLEAELTEHLGYEKHSPLGRNTGNNRNGKSRKSLKNDNGEIELTIPRGVELRAEALKLLTLHSDAMQLKIDWIRREIKFNAFKRWVELWEKD